jgi:hypothetical protein
MRIGSLYMRAVRRLGLDRNPLRRPSDRIEAGLLCGIIVAFGVLAPLTAVKAGQWVAAAGAREVRAEQTSHPAAVTTIRTPPHRPALYKATGLVATSEGALAAASVSARGSEAHPLTMAQVRSRAEVTVMLAPIVLGLVMCLVFWVLRRALDRRRARAWGLAWSIIGPQWSDRR